MDSEYKLYLQRAQNELNLSRIILRISDDKDLQISTFAMKEDTYYSATIAHAYYSIFYGAKAYLLVSGIKTEPPEEHKKTFDQFSKLVDKGIIDVQFLRIYKNMLVRADTLLHIFKLEKGKRGNFTYRRMPQANREPAKESIDNATKFFMHIFNLCREE